eukprot:2809238-Alexandrium_andersonii.AAC.1
MSASLVGSEMCIRDRQTRAQQQSEAQSSGVSDEIRILRSELEEQKMPVSYTHLTLPTICSV